MELRITEVTGTLQPQEGGLVKRDWRSWLGSEATVVTSASPRSPGLRSSLRGYWGLLGPFLVGAAPASPGNGADGGKTEGTNWSHLHPQETRCSRPGPPAEMERKLNPGAGSVGGPLVEATQALFSWTKSPS